MNKLNLYTPINSLGYGVVGFNVWRQLNRTSDVTLWPISNQVQPPVNLTDDLHYQISIDIKKQNEYDPTLPCLKIWHENHLADRIGRGLYAAFPFFEINELDSRRKTHIQSTDILFVASNWAKGVVEDQTGHPNVHVVPCGVDRSIFGDMQAKCRDDVCVFMNCGKWEYRKGHDVLGAAFKDAFQGGERVELWMMTHNPFLSEAETYEWEKMYMDERIRLLPRVQTQEELAEIMAEAFCGVFPSRAEGWNLEIPEMMSLGKHIIATANTAHLDFCTPDNSLLLSSDETEIAYDGKWFAGQGTWSSLSHDDVVDALRAVYRRWTENPAQVNNEGIKTAKELTWEQTEKKISTTIFSA